MKSNLVIPLEIFSIRKYIPNIKFTSSCFDINGTRQYEFLKRQNLNLCPLPEFVGRSELEPAQGEAALKALPWI